MVEAIFGGRNRRASAPSFAPLSASMRMSPPAQPRPSLAVDDHCLDGIVIAPFEQRVDHRLAHRQVERVDRLRTIERQVAGAAVDRDEDVVGHIAGLETAFARLSPSSGRTAAKETPFVLEEPLSLSKRRPGSIVFIIGVANPFPRSFA